MLQTYVTIRMRFSVFPLIHENIRICQSLPIKKPNSEMEPTVCIQSICRSINKSTKTQSDKMKCYYWHYWEWAGAVIDPLCQTTASNSTTITTLKGQTDSWFQEESVGDSQCGPMGVNRALIVACVHNDVFVTCHVSSTAKLFKSLMNTNSHIMYADQ